LFKICGNAAVGQADSAAPPAPIINIVNAALEKAAIDHAPALRPVERGH
jgi:hypothetical protein